MSVESLREAERHGTVCPAAAGRRETAQTAWLLLCHILGMDSTDYILARERELPAEAARRYVAMLEQRAEGVPLQYPTRAQNFCGLELYMDERVLIPRYDMECLVEAMLRDRREGRLLNPCTGSSCIPLALLKLGGFHSALGADISADTLAVVEINRARTGLPLSLRRSDLLSEIPERFDVITVNPPYIESTEIETLGVEVRDHESRFALDDTADGLAFYRRLAAESGARLTDDGGLYLEISAPQGTAVTALLRAAAFSDIQIIQDLAGRDRAMKGTFHGRGTSQRNAAPL